MRTIASRFAPVGAALLMMTVLTQMTVAAGPTTVPLGTAASFAILAGDAVTNVPTSAITGDVGLSPATGAAITGLTCAEVDGTIYTVDAAGPLCRNQNAGLLTTAKNALTTAYNDAAGRTPGATFSGADNQLGGQNLVAGTYRFPGASTANLIGNLTLTGAADDVWIFQATSTLVTAASSSITFSGGAQACNVFWQVGSAATLGASSSFAGTILAHDDISLGSQVTVDGRLLAGGQANHAGAVTLIMDTIIRSDCAAAPAPTATAAAPTATAGPVATATAGPVATSTAPPAATPTAGPVVTPGPGATVTTSIASPTLVAPAPTAPTTSTLPTDGSSSGAPIAIYILLFVGLVAFLIARAPSRAR